MPGLIAPEVITGAGRSDVHAEKERASANENGTKYVDLTIQ
jgi:hypothetical protein